MRETISGNVPPCRAKCHRLQLFSIAPPHKDRNAHFCEDWTIFYLFYLFEGFDNPAMPFFGTKLLAASQAAGGRHGHATACPLRQGRVPTSSGHCWEGADGLQEDWGWSIWARCPVNLWRWKMEPPSLRLDDFYKTYIMETDTCFLMAILQSYVSLPKGNSPVVNGGSKLRMWYPYSSYKPRGANEIWSEFPNHMMA